MADKGSVTGNIVHYIRKNIADGKWKVGELIPSENQMCKTLGVSRVSVRSALQKFIALGILESVHGKGTYLVTDDLSLFASLSSEDTESGALSVKDLRYLLEFRALIEPDICQMVAPTASPELINTMDEKLQIMRDSVGSTKNFVDADVEYHMAICHECNNPITESVMSDILLKRAAYGYLLNMAVGYYGGMYYHALILDAFRAHDGKRASTLMLEHLRSSIFDLEADNSEEHTIIDA